MTPFLSLPFRQWFGSLGGVRRAVRLPAVWALAAVGLAVVLISCGTVTRTVVAPPSIPGATYIGSAACADCHEKLCRDFKTASHAALLAKGPNAAEIGCESCHGPGSLHNESGGGPRTILNPKKSAEVCFQCHLDKRGEFHSASHHPVLEGRVTCGDCHDPHQGSAVKGGGTALSSESETCLACHTAQRGPHVFEHEAMREGCTICHRPHGSVNAKLLTHRNATLCFRCHFQEQQAGGRVRIGGQDHTAFLRQGTCWSGGCHEAVHGSQVNSSLRY
jgi:predicted CXXCH cytochrome family protein